MFREFLEAFNLEHRMKSLEQMTLQLCNQHVKHTNASYGVCIMSPGNFKVYSGLRLNYVAIMIM